MGYFQVRYDSRVVNYDHRGFIRLATEDISILQEENTNLRWSVTVCLTSCLFCLNSAALISLSEQQFYLFGQIQNCQTGGWPYSDTSTYGECFLLQVNYSFWCSTGLRNTLPSSSPEENDSEIWCFVGTFAEGEIILLPKSVKWKYFLRMHILWDSIHWSKRTIIVAPYILLVGPIEIAVNTLR